MNDRAELDHCYSLALDALRAGGDRTAAMRAAAHHLRPDGVLSWSDVSIAEQAVREAFETFDGSAERRISAILDAIIDRRKP